MEATMHKQGERVRDIAEIRETLNQLVRQKSVSPDAADAARGALHTMFDEASEFGLTSADVIRSVFSPVFWPTPECECATCRSRRARLESDSLAGLV
jgi:hypothetical protein